MEMIQLAERIKTDVEALSAGQDGVTAGLLESVALLRRMIEPPAQRMSSLRSQVLQNVSLLMAEEMGLIDVIVQNAEKHMSSAQLAHKTGHDEDLIVRLMRVLTAMGVCDEVKGQTYCSNKLAENQSLPVSKGGLVLSNDLVFPIGAKIRSYVKEHKAGHLQSSTESGPFEFTYGKSVWEALKTDPHLKKAFDDNLAGRSSLHPVRWHDKYPAASRLENGLVGGSDEVLVVDVGGNHGYDLVTFQDQNPHLLGRLVLQDLPETLSRIAQPLQRIEVMAHDFFTPQAIRGARLYYLHSVCHDWPDPACRKILSHIANSMDVNSRLLIDEIVLEDVGESIGRVEMDILMLLLCNGGERSLRQWEGLLASATPSLRILKVWNAPGEQQSIIEAAL